MALRQGLGSLPHVTVVWLVRAVSAPKEGNSSHVGLREKRGFISLHN